MIQKFVLNLNDAKERNRFLTDYEERIKCVGGIRRHYWIGTRVIQSPNII